MNMISKWTNKMDLDKAWWELCNNATSYREQILEGTELPIK